MRKGIKLVTANAIKLTPGSKYLLIFDEGTITEDNLQSLSSMLNDEGVFAISLAIQGDASKVKIIEQAK